MKQAIVSYHIGDDNHWVTKIAWGLDCNKYGIGAPKDS